MSEVYANVVLKAFFIVAEEHGKSSEPDHEVGDLQDALRLCLPMLSTQQLNDLIDELTAEQNDFEDLFEGRVSTPADVLSTIFEAAKLHGEDDDLEHEVGDLQCALSSVLLMLEMDKLQVVTDSFKKQHISFEDVFEDLLGDVEEG